MGVTTHIQNDFVSKAKIPARTFKRHKTILPQQSQHHHRQKLTDAKLKLRENIKARLSKKGLKAPTLGPAHADEIDNWVKQLSLNFPINVTPAPCMTQATDSTKWSRYYFDRNIFVDHSFPLYHTQPLQHYLQASMHSAGIPLASVRQSAPIYGSPLSFNSTHSDQMMLSPLLDTSESTAFSDYQPNKTINKFYEIKSRDTTDKLFAEYLNFEYI